MMTAAYLDTCLVSALVKQDIAGIELAALNEILDAFEGGTVTLLCSSAVEDELARIPAQFRDPHLRQLKIFGSIPRARPGGLTRLGLAGVPATNPRRILWERLLDILPDRQDAEHVFIAACNRLHNLVTVDFRTFLKHKKIVEEVSGVRLMTPSELVVVVAAER